MKEATYMQINKAIDNGDLKEVSRLIAPFAPKQKYSKDVLIAMLVEKLVNYRDIASMIYMDGTDCLEKRHSTIVHEKKIARFFRDHSNNWNASMLTSRISDVRNVIDDVTNGEVAMTLCDLDPNNRFYVITDLNKAGYLKDSSLSTEGILLDMGFMEVDVDNPEELDFLYSPWYSPKLRRKK